MIILLPYSFNHKILTEIAWRAVSVHIACVYSYHSILSRADFNQAFVVDVYL